MSTFENSSVDPARQSAADADATFRGWQSTPSGKVFALYNITSPGHPSIGSTVTEEGLHNLKLQVPDTPLPQAPPRKSGTSG